MLKILKYKKIKNQKAQMIANEYVIVFFVVLAIIAAMSTYFRRAIQSRVRGAYKVMEYTAYARINSSTAVNASRYSGSSHHAQYEPYYTESISDITRAGDTNQFAVAGNILKKTIDDTTTSDSVTITAPPIDAD